MATSPPSTASPPKRPKRGSRRCIFCGLPAHGTYRGVRRCLERTVALALALGAETAIEEDSAHYPYRWASTNGQ